MERERGGERISGRRNEKGDREREGWGGKDKISGRGMRRGERRSGKGNEKVDRERERWGGGEERRSGRGNDKDG